MSTSRQPRVLLADDEVLIRVLVEEALRDAGYEVTAAASGVEAVTTLEKEEQFVGLVTDINFGRPPRLERRVACARNQPPHRSGLHNRR